MKSPPSIFETAILNVIMRSFLLFFRTFFVIFIIMKWRNKWLIISLFGWIRLLSYHRKLLLRNVAWSFIRVLRTNEHSNGGKDYIFRGVYSSWHEYICLPRVLHTRIRLSGELGLPIPLVRINGVHPYSLLLLHWLNLLRPLLRSIRMFVGKLWLPGLHSIILLRHRLCKIGHWNGKWWKSHLLGRMLLVSLWASWYLRIFLN